MVIVVNSFRKQSSSKQKKLKLQVQRVGDYTTYYQALPEHSIKERGILKGIIRPGFIQAAKHPQRSSKQ